MCALQCSARTFQPLLPPCEPSSTPRTCPVPRYTPGSPRLSRFHGGEVSGWSSMAKVHNLQRLKDAPFRRPEVNPESQCKDLLFGGCESKPCKPFLVRSLVSVNNWQISIVSLCLSNLHQALSYPDITACASESVCRAAAQPSRAYG